MRCKNCGSENDNNLYICQNCGSPLYEEDEQSTKAINTDELNKFNNGSREQMQHSPADNSEKEAKKNQQMVAIIVILAVLLVSIIIGTVVAVAHNKAKNEGIDTPSVSDELSSSDESISQSTTDESTTESTTTTTTTTTTTQAVKFTVTLSCTDGGEVEGDGNYASGEAVTVIARPDDGYAFDGWYSSGSRVSGNTKYKFTINSDKSLEAKFIPVGGEDFDLVDGVDEE